MEQFEQLRYVELFLSFDETLSRIFSHLIMGKFEQLRYNFLKWGGRMALSQEVKEKLQKRIEELKKRMQYDANDLDYETHLNQVRELQQLIDRSK